MEHSTISQIHKKIIAKEISCKELVQGFLDTTKENDGDIHAYLEMDAEGALKQAEEVDKNIGNKDFNAKSQMSNVKSNPKLKLLNS